MIRNTLILLSLIATCVGYMLYADYRETAPSPQHKAQSVNNKTQLPAPQFSFQDLKGRKYALADFKDKVVILNFWASWCAPCAIEFPQMMELARATSEDSIIIFMSVDDNKQDIERFLKKYGKGVPQKNIIIGWDMDKSISQGLFQTYRLPETFFIAPDMTIAEKIIGADVEWNGVEMREKIKALSLKP